MTLEFGKCPSGKARMATEWAIIPCGADKLDTAAPAADLYTSSTFRSTLAAALTLVDPAHVLVLSAKHGLVALDTVVDPYDTKMGDPGTVTVGTVVAQAVVAGIAADDDVSALLPSAYFAKLDEALRYLDVFPTPVFEGTRGIGDHRGVARVLQAA